MNLSIDKLGVFGLSLFEEFYAERPPRASDGKKHQDREAMAWAFMRLAVRYKLRSLFTLEAIEELDECFGK